MTGLKAGCTRRVRLRHGDRARISERDRARASLATTRSRSPTRPTGLDGQKSVSLQINAADTRRATVTYKATGLPSGLSINGSTGKIPGSPRGIGKSTVTIIVADGVGTGADNVD